MSPDDSTNVYYRTEAEKAAKQKGDGGLGDYIGIAPDTNRLLFFTSQVCRTAALLSDALMYSQADHLGDETIDVQRVIVRKYPKLDFRSDLADAHLYIFAKVRHVLG